MSFMDSLFGSSKMPEYLEEYNKAQAQYGQDQMAANQANWNTALQASQLGAESDIQYGTASGQYLQGNPYISGIADTTTQAIMDSYNNSYIPQALSSYAASGRYGSGGMANSLTDMQSQMNQDIGSAINDLYYNNYSTERGYQESAASRLGQQYDDLARSAQYSNIINNFQTSPTMYEESDPGLVGNLGQLMGLAQQGAKLAGFGSGPMGSGVGGADGSAIGQ